MKIKISNKNQKNLPQISPRTEKSTYDYLKTYSNTLPSEIDKNTQNCKRILEYFEANEDEEETLKILGNLKNPIRNSNLKLIKLNMKNPDDIKKEVNTKFKIITKLKEMNSESPNIRREITTKNTNTKFFYTTRTSTDSNNKSEIKVKEVNNLVTLSKKNYFKGNLIFNNLLTLIYSEHLKSSVFDELKYFTKVEIDQINSENKQIQIFLIILDKIINLLISISLDEKNNCNTVENNYIHSELLDSFFLDFTIHLSTSSNFRAEFLQKIWKQKIILNQEIIFQYKKNNKKLEEDFKNFKKKTENILEINQKLKKDNDNLNSDIKMYKIQIEKLNMMLENKEKENEELNEIVLNKVNELDMKNKIIDEYMTEERKFSMLSNKTINEDSTNTSFNLNVKELMMTRLQRSSVINNSLSFKSKLSEKKKQMLMQQRKHKRNNNNNSLIDENAENMENSSQVINSSEISKLHKGMNLYLNKGYNLTTTRFCDNQSQTEITLMNIDYILNDKFKILETNSESVKGHLKTLTQIFERLSNNKNVQNDGEKITKALHDSNEEFLKNIKQLINECDLIVKENENIRNKLENIYENNSDLKDNYSEIFKILVKNIAQNNEEMSNFILENSNKINEEDFAKFLNKIIDKNASLIEKNKNIIFTLTPNVVLKHSTSKEFNNSRSGICYISKISSKNEILSYSTELINEYKNNPGKIKLQLNKRKTLKLIDSIFFENIEKIYFKKDKLNFDREENFVIFSEVSLIYFNNLFGLKSLAKKKFLEFVHSVTNYRNDHKRIQIFYKLMGINNNNNDSLDKFSIFISRQMILFIQYLKIKDCIMSRPSHYQDDLEKNKIILNYNKISEDINFITQNLPFSVQNKNILQAQIEKAKFLTANNIQVVDIEVVLESLGNSLTEIEVNYNKILKIIFNAIDLENKNHLNFLDFIICREYIMTKNNSYKQVKNSFERYSDMMRHMNLEQFVAVCIENDLVEIDFFDDYMKIGDIEIKKIIYSLHENLKESSMTIFDSMEKRIVIIKDETKIKSLNKKIINLKQKIFELSSPVNELWLSLRLLDDITLHIYNEFKIQCVFKNLSDTISIMEEYLPDEEKERKNMIIYYLNI